MTVWAPRMRAFVFAMGATLALVFGPQSVAQPERQGIFGNPFATAQELHALRGETPSASLRVRFEATNENMNGRFGEGEVVIELASDWARLRSEQLEYVSDLLLDFKTNRVLSLRADGSFQNWSGLGPAATADWMARLVAEEIRIVRERGYRETADACDAEMLGRRLGVIDGVPVPVVLTLTADRIEAHCAGRLIGYARIGAEPAPAPLWPILAQRFAIHPALLAAVRTTGRVPLELNATYRQSGATQHETLTLLAAEHIAAPYPLRTSARNATAPIQSSSEIERLMELARTAVSGRAGATDLAAWQSRLARARPTEGMLTLDVVSFGMFPEMRAHCREQPQDRSPICEAQRTRASSRDPAVQAMARIVQAEDRREFGAVLNAMSVARGRRGSDHPILEYRFIEALLAGEWDLLRQARERGLPSDISAVRYRAIHAFPYSPELWARLGDAPLHSAFANEGLLYFEIAASLPVPGAVDSEAMQERRKRLEDIRALYPHFFLGD